jgi:hypothetical protein
MKTSTHRFLNNPTIIGKTTAAGAATYKNAGSPARATSHQAQSSPSATRALAHHALF